MNQTAICNLALLRIGINKQLASINDADPAADALRVLWTPIIDSMLRERPWPFALRQVELAVADTEKMTGWYYAYAYPSNFISVWRVVPAETSTTAPPLVYSVTRDLATNLPPTTYPFGIGSLGAERIVFSNVNPAVAVGTYRVTDTGLFDSAFSDALAWRLAFECAPSLTKNTEARNTARTEYDLAVSMAFAASLNEPKPEDARDAEAIEART